MRDFTTQLGPANHPLLALNGSSINAKLQTLMTQDGSEALGGRLKNARTDILVEEKASKRYWNMSAAIRELLQNIADEVLRVGENLGEELRWVTENTPSGAKLLINGQYAGEWLIKYEEDIHKLEPHIALYFYNRGSMLPIDAFYRAWSNKSSNNQLYLAGGHGYGLKQSLNTFFSEGFDEILIYTWTNQENTELQPHHRRYELNKDNVTQYPHGTQTYRMDVTDTDQSKKDAPSIYKQAKALDKTAPGTLFCIRKFTTDVTTVEKYANTVLTSAETHFFARKPANEVINEKNSETTIMYFQNSKNPQQGFPSTLIHRNLEVQTFVGAKLHIHVFPGLLLTTLPIPDHCTIPWPDMMAPQRTLSMFGQHSNVDRQANWNSCLESVYVTTLSLSAWQELDRIRKENKSLPDPIEDQMLAPGVLPPSMHVIARWVWTLLKASDSVVTKLSDRCSMAMLNIFHEDCKEVILALFQKVIWVSSVEDKEKLELLSSTPNIPNVEQFKFVMQVPKIGNFAQQLGKKVMKPNEVISLIRQNLLYLIKETTPWEPKFVSKSHPNYDRKADGTFRAWLKKKEFLPKAYALNIDPKLMQRGANGCWMKIKKSMESNDEDSLSSSDEDDDEDEFNIGDESSKGIQNNQKAFIFSSRKPVSDEKIATTLLLSHKEALMDLLASLPDDDEERTGKVETKVLNSTTPVMPSELVVKEEKVNTSIPYPKLTTADTEFPNEVKSERENHAHSSSPEGYSPIHMTENNDFYDDGYDGISAANSPSEKKQYSPNTNTVQFQDDEVVDECIDESNVAGTKLDFSTYSTSTNRKRTLEEDDGLTIYNTSEASTHSSNKKPNNINITLKTIMDGLKSMREQNEKYFQLNDSEILKQISNLESIHECEKSRN